MGTGLDGGGLRAKLSNWQGLEDARTVNRHKADEHFQ